MNVTSSITLVIVALLFASCATTNTQDTTKAPDVEQAYNPRINPSELSVDITNPYFSLPIGTKLSYIGEADEGTETTVIEVDGSTRKIMGVTTLKYHDRVYLDGVLVEDTLDYLAQDREGNVWYFGEEVNNYEDGTLTNHHGSWIAGENGALPGIWIKAHPVVDDSYRQEYFAGEAEDMTTVVAVNKTVITSMATYEGCVQMYDWTPLDASSREHKYYCPAVGALVLAENLVSAERVELAGVGGK